MKKFARFVGIVVVGLVVGLSMVGCFPLDEDEGTGGGGTGGGGGGGGIAKMPSLTIKNSTGYTIGGGVSSYRGVWIKPSTEALSWGDNLAYWSSDQLTDGQSKSYTLSQPLSVQNVYDIRLDGGDGYSFRKYGVTVSNGMTVTFTTSDLDNGSSLPTVTIQNRSGKTFNSIHIKPSVVSDFGSTFGDLSNNADKSVTIQIPPSNHTVFDIQMKSTNPTNTYTRSNVTISKGMTLLFTSADADNPTIELPVIVIHNKTGYTVGGGVSSTRGIWIRPSSSTDWGDNLAYWSSDQLIDGQSKAYTLSQHLSANNVYDVRLMGEGFTFIKYNVTVSEGMILTFTTADVER